MRKRVPDNYRELGCCEEGSQVLGCDYVNICQGDCNFRRKYHPVERVKFLQGQARAMAQDQSNLEGL